MKDLPLARYASPLQLEPLRIRSARAVGNSAGNFRNSVAGTRLFVEFVIGLMAATMIEHSRISLAPDVLVGKPVIRAGFE
jgi:hypothetical protein